MTDLSLEGSHQFWQEYQDKNIYKVLAFMESVENWTYDGEKDIEDAMNKLSTSLKNITRKAFKLNNEQLYIQSVSYLHMTRLLKLLQTVDSIKPGSASKILMFAEDNYSRNKYVRLFLQRNLSFERLRLLSRVFSTKRLQLISNVLENDEEDEF